MFLFALGALITAASSLQGANRHALDRQKLFLWVLNQKTLPPGSLEHMQIHLDASSLTEQDLEQARGLLKAVTLVLPNSPETGYAMVRALAPEVLELVPSDMVVLHHLGDPTSYPVSWLQVPGLRIIDDSWHNDAMSKLMIYDAAASAGRVGGEDGEDGELGTIWINYDDPAEREIQGYRWGLSLGTWLEQQDSDGKSDIYTNDPAEILMHLWALSLRIFRISRVGPAES